MLHKGPKVRLSGPACVAAGLMAVRLQVLFRRSPQSCGWLGTTGLAPPKRVNYMSIRVQCLIAPNFASTASLLYVAGRTHGISLTPLISDYGDGWANRVCMPCRLFPLIIINK